MKKELALLLTVVFAYQQVFAQGERRFGKPTVLIDHVFVLDEAQPHYAVIRKSALQAFYMSEQVSIVPPKTIAQYLEKQTPTSEENSNLQLNRARELLNQGVLAYQSLEFKKALEFLVESRDQWLKHISLLRSNRDLLKAHLYLGMTYIALDKSNPDPGYIEKAKNEFQKVVYLDTQLVLSSRSYSPEVISLYEEVKQRLLNRDRVALKISSNVSNAQVYINGKREGSAPLTVRLLPGTYYVLVDSSVANTNAWGELIDIRRPVQEVQAQITPNINIAKEQQLFQIREGKGAQNHAQVQTLHQRAQALGADMVYLSNLERLDGYRLLGQLYDVRTEEFSQVAFVHIGHDLKDVEGVSFDLAQALISQIREDGYLVNSQRKKMGQPSGFNQEIGQQAQSTGEVQKAQKPPTKLYKKWWFWAGIVAVGAGGYFAYDQLGESSSGGIQIDNAGNF